MSNSSKTTSLPYDVFFLCLIEQTLTGNTDQDTVVRNEVQVFQAMYLRFRPQTWNGDLISMRVEVYGCPPRKD